MKNILLIGLLSFLLSGCCNYGCDCFDECDRAIGFSFSTDSLNSGFSNAEIDTIVLYKLVKGQNNPVDSINLYLFPGNTSLSTRPEGDWMCGAFRGFTISEVGPFRGDDFGQFDYRILIPKIKTFNITNIDVQGHMKGNSCCKCYKNDKKNLELDGISQDLLNGTSNQNAIVLTK